MTEFNIEEALQKGIKAARRGHKEPAQRLLSQVVEADPHNEQGWLWLARVVDDPQMQAQCLQRALAINPDNQWAAEQLSGLQSQAAAPEQAAPTGSTPTPGYAEPSPASDIKLETLKCPNCQASLELRGGSDIKSIVCNYCGSVLDLTEEQAAIIGQADRQVKPMVPIELGMEWKYKGQQYQVIGWIRYEGWDDEDTWQWEEWLLVSGSGQYRWLSYDPEKKQFQLYKKISPRAPFNPRRDTNIKVPGGVARIVERAPARIAALAGELTWRAKVGDELNYIDARRGSVPYSVEYNTEELELLEGINLPETEIWQGFGRDDLLQEARQRKTERSAELNKIGKGHAQFSRRAYIFLALAIIFIMFMFCCVFGGGGLVGPGYITSQSVRAGSVTGPSIGGGGTSLGK